MIAGARRGRLALFLLVVGLLAACSEAEPEGGEVVLYTSMPDAIVAQLQGVIEQRFPDLEGDYWAPARDPISLRVVRGRTADIQRRIDNEIRSGGIEADVIWLAEPSPYETYTQMGLLAPYEPPDDAPMPAGYIDPDGFYVAARIISMGLAWNTDLRPEGLVDWPDLHEAGSSAFPAPDSGAARATIKAVTERHGDEFFTDLAGAGGVSVSSNGVARDGVVEGTFEAAAVLDYMVRQAKEDGSPIDFAYPASGTVLIPSPIAITADASNPAAAKDFIDFILSDPGQKIVVEIGSFYPVRTDISPPEGAAPLDTIEALEVDWKALAAETEEINKFWDGLYGPPTTSS